jgi:hypothetical protein
VTGVQCMMENSITLVVDSARKMQISMLSHRFRTVLQTLGAVNQVSTETQVRLQTHTYMFYILVYTYIFMYVCICMCIELYCSCNACIASAGIRHFHAVSDSDVTRRVLHVHNKYSQLIQDGLTRLRSVRRVPMTVYSCIMYGVAPTMYLALMTWHHNCCRAGCAHTHATAAQHS